MIKIKQGRFAIGVTSLLLLSSCRPLLSSHGDTHSPYQPQTQKHNTEKTTSGNGSGSTSSSGHSSGHGTGTSGSTGPTGAVTTPTGAPSPTPTPTNKDLDRKLDEMKVDEVLKISFNDSLEFPYDRATDEKEFDRAGCRSVYIEGGKIQKDGDDSHFSCLVHYCVDSTNNDDDTRYLFQVPKDTTYLFRKKDINSSGDRKPHVKLLIVNGEDTAGGIEQLKCDGMGGSLTVRDLIEAFGKDTATGKVDKIDAHIVSLTSLLDTSRNPASVPAVSQTSRPERASERKKADLPNFALQLTGSVKAFGGSTISPAQQGIKSGAMLIQLEYQPSFLQHFGIFSIGPSFGTYPTLGTAQGDEKVTPGFFSITGIGGQVRYQLHYFNDQFIVPYASYEAQSLSYRINQGGSGRLTVAGGSGGLSLLLNRLAPSEAIDMKQDLGISRSYLVVEGKYLYGTDQNVRVSGTSVFFGLRFEK